MLSRFLSYIIELLPDFLQRCLSTPETKNETTLDSPSSMPLLQEWAKLELTKGSYSDALYAARNVS